VAISAIGLPPSDHGLQAAQVHRDLAGQSLADHPLGDLADPGQAAQPGRGRGRQPLQLGRVGTVDGGRGPAEGTHLVGRLAGPLEQERDPAQGGRRCQRLVGHGPILRAGTAGGQPERSITIRPRRANDRRRCLSKGGSSGTKERAR
jgi:hypothetical protein